MSKGKVERKKMTWGEAVRYLRDYNKKHGIQTKGADDLKCTMVAVITQGSFNNAYSEESRSYRFTNLNKAFLPNCSSNSIFADSLDGEDCGVRIDYYIPNTWEVEYCYIESEEG